MNSVLFQSNQPGTVMERITKISAIYRNVRDQSSQKKKKGKRKGGVIEGSNERQNEPYV